MIAPLSDNENGKTPAQSDFEHTGQSDKSLVPSSFCSTSEILANSGNEEFLLKTDSLAQSEIQATDNEEQKLEDNLCPISKSDHEVSKKDIEILSQPVSSSPNQKVQKGKMTTKKTKPKVVKKFPRNSVTSSSKLSYNRKSKHFSTSYWNLKKGLIKRPVGRPRKYFDHGKIDVKEHPSPVPDDPNDVKKTISAPCFANAIENHGKNSQAKVKNKKPKESEESNNDYSGNQEQGSTAEDGSRRKRGRPRLVKNLGSLMRDQETALPMKKVSAKKKRRPRNDFPIKIRNKVKPSKEAALTGHISGQADTITFVQHINCLNDKMRIPKCRECRSAAYNRSTWNMVNSYCRFLEYRKLFATRDGSIMFAGFLQPSDSTDADKSLWLPNVSHPPGDLTIATSKELLIQVGDQFCDLVQQEKDTVSLHLGLDKSMTWKKLVPGVREMCDVCDTTLFNIHWVCHKCGFAVCIDCYKVRKQGVMIDEESQMKSRDDYLWLFCHNRVPHEQEQMIMAQMVPGDALWSMNETMHKVREKWNIPAYCKCAAKENVSMHKSSVTTGICKQLMSNVSKSFASVSLFHANNKNNPSPACDRNLNIKIPESALKWLQNSQWEETDFESNQFPCSQLLPEDDEDDDVPEYVKQGQIKHTFPSVSEMIDSFKQIHTEEHGKCTSGASLHVNNRYPQPSGGRQPLPVRIFTCIESEMLFNNNCHSWLCHGRLLLLHLPDHSGNLELFQEQWKRGQPIMVARVDRKLDMSLWHPDGFCRDFGDIVNDLVNCRTGAIIPKLPMKKFWLGFENLDQRMKDDSGEYMLLKLKDWPPGEDFSEKLPKRFQDLMKSLPLPEYTHRDGIFNLAGRLPSWFVRPDLGPKMYNAYGSALYPTKGTTNLHLDISDAVNVMVYVGIPHDGKDEEHIVQALKAIDEGGCDSLTRERVRSRGVKPGALWHIYDSRSVDKIRDFLTKVAIERGEKLEANHDPIHDQSWYLDTKLRRRLYLEYGVQGYAIAQCLGDAVFIPAGAPHQVRNLHSCVKVAEDFVSPENIAHCFKLTQEFRHLSHTHTNHEDKLQIKNIIYHVVKDALSHLM